MSGRRNGIRKAVIATATAGVLLTAPYSAAVAPPEQVSASFFGTNGASVIQAGGQSCASGGSGHHRHVTVSSPLSANDPVISAALPGTMTGFFDVVRDGGEPVDTPLPPGSQAFLYGTESTVKLTNARGTVMLRLESGSCQAPTLAFDGFTVLGTGVWSVDPVGTTGSYAPAGSPPATGGGTFGLQLGVRPNANNPWTLDLQGSMNVAQPALQVTVARTRFVGFFDLFKRILTVTYRVTNSGPGDSFAPVLTGAEALTPRATVIGPVPQTLPDLPHGTSTLVSVRYQLGRPGPCGLIRCAFDTNVSVEMPDAFDNVDDNAPAVLAHVRFPF